MTLLAHANSLPLVRHLGLPAHGRICLILASSCLGEAARLARSHPALTVEQIVLTDWTPETPATHSVTGRDAATVIGVSGPQTLENFPHLEKVYYARPDDPDLQELTLLCHLLAMCGVAPLYILQGADAANITTRPPQKELYARFGPMFERVYACLADDASKEVYAARVKALATGNAGYLPVSDHPEYYHPLVRPEKGDVLIDGGVSDMVAVQKCFAESVGPAGMVYGFEPIPGMFAAAQEQLRAYPQYSLHCMGLGEKEGSLRFAEKRDSSHVCDDEAENAVSCRVTSIDAFAAAHGLSRIRCIKLDVEGSELAALEGARHTILAGRPKLIVCLYHKLEDMIAIPLFIKALVPEYEIYIAHSSVHFGDTVLYARLPE